MSLLTAPIAERRRWVAEVAPRLYNLQKARFQYISQGQSRERVLAWKLVKLAHGPEYIKAIATTISHFDLNDIATLTTYWKILENAESDEDFARILTFDSLHPDSRPSTITLNNIYVDNQPREQVDLTRVQNLVLRYQLAKQEGKVLSLDQFLREIGRYAAGFGSFILFNTLMKHGFHSLDDRMINIQTVPCTISGLPLRHVQEIEVARSGRILKFRATGSVFLAQQEGGEDAIRIEGLLARSEIVFILILWALFLYGQGKVKEIDKIVELVGNPGLMAIRAKNVDITTFNATTELPSYTHHVTFPLVTRHIVIPNVYIETMSFEEKVVFGKDIIGYSLLLRTYRKPTGFEMYSQSPTMNFLAPKGDKFLSMYKVVEFFANMAWRFINSNGIFIQEREWKIGGDTAQSDDVYYNINAGDVATSAVLGLIGVL